MRVVTITSTLDIDIDVHMDKERERVTNVYNLIVSPTSEGGQNHLYPRYRYRYRCSHGQIERESDKCLQSDSIPNK